MVANETRRLLAYFSGLEIGSFFDGCCVSFLKGTAIDVDVAGLKACFVGFEINCPEVGWMAIRPVTGLVAMDFRDRSVRVVVLMVCLRLNAGFV